jgi:hypothetical protein
MSDLERRLEDLFMSDSRSRRVTDVKVPGRSTSPLRGLAFIGVTALAVLALIVALNTLRPPQEVVPLTSPSASATASVSPAASATVGSAPSATSGPPAASALGVRPDASHGMLTRNPAAIRTESDPTALNRTPNWDEGAAAAVSPDGKRVAMLGGSRGQRLISFTTTRPDEITTLVDLTSSGEFIVGPPVWAADGSDSLLVGVVKPSGQAGVEPPPSYAALRSIDTKTRAVAELTRTTNNYVVVPVAWHPGGGVAAAYETGPGGLAVAYVVVRGQQVTRTPFGGDVVASTIVANEDGTRVLALDGRDGATVRWWSFDRFDQQTELKPTAGEGVYRATWRSRRDEIVVAVGQSGPTSTPRSFSAMRLEVWGSQSGRRVVRDTGGLALVRVDGTAALAADYQLVDLTTGATTPVQKRAATETPYLAVLF